MSWTDSSVEERIAAFEAEAPRFSDWDELRALASERATDWRPALEERLRAGMEERDGKIVARGSLAAAGAALHWVGAERPSAKLPRLGELELPILLVVAARNDTSPQVARFRSAVPRAAVWEVDSSTTSSRTPQRNQSRRG
jgi:hypothetical protein